jgi:hypothetical protein
MTTRESTWCSSSSECLQHGSTAHSSHPLHRYISSSSSAVEKPTLLTYSRRSKVSMSQHSTALESQHST